MINVVVAGHWYAVTAALEYIARAFKRREDCNVVTVGTYPGLWMPWTKNGNVGVVMPDKYDCMPDIQINYNSGIQSAPIGYIESQLPFQPDLWVDVNAGFHLDGRPKHGIRTLFETDPHTGLRGIYNNTAHFYDYRFCPQTPYAVEGEIYLPYAADSEWHSPMPGLEKIYDVTLIGNTYPQRVEFMNRLNGRGIKTFFELGLAKDDARIIYNQSIIGLNWSSMDDLTARVFEIMGLGIVPVINRVPDLPKLFVEGIHYYGFSSAEEAEDRVNFILINPDKAAIVAQNARNCIVEGGHTWDDRVATILKTVELI